MNQNVIYIGGQKKIVFVNELVLEKSYREIDKHLIEVDLLSLEKIYSYSDQNILEIDELVLEKSYSMSNFYNTAQLVQCTGTGIGGATSIYIDSYMFFGLTQENADFKAKAFGSGILRCV